MLLLFIKILKEKAIEKNSNVACIMGNHDLHTLCIDNNLFPYVHTTAFGFYHTIELPESLDFQNFIGFYSKFVKKYEDEDDDDDEDEDDNKKFIKKFIKYPTGMFTYIRSDKFNAKKKNLLQLLNDYITLYKLDVDIKVYNFLYDNMHKLPLSNRRQILLPLYADFTFYAHVFRGEDPIPEITFLHGGLHFQDPQKQDEDPQKIKDQMYQLELSDKSFLQLKMNKDFQNFTINMNSFIYDLNNIVWTRFYNDLKENDDKCAQLGFGTKVPRIIVVGHCNMPFKHNHLPRNGKSDMGCLTTNKGPDNTCIYPKCYHQKNHQPQIVLIDTMMSSCFRGINANVNHETLVFTKREAPKSEDPYYDMFYDFQSNRNPIKFATSGGKTRRRKPKRSKRKRLHYVYGRKNSNVSTRNAKKQYNNTKKYRKRFTSRL